MSISYNKPILNKNGEPLKLLEAAAHHCIRCVKKTRALRKLGYEIHGMGNKVSYGTEEYNTYTVWQNEKQFKNAIKMYIGMGINVITWDNEPDHPVIWIRQIINEMNKQDEVKLVVDLHDLDHVRRGFIPLQERHMFNTGDAFIYVSEPIQKITNDLHKVNKPNILLYSYCNKEFINFQEPKGNILVYEGGLNPPNDQSMNQQFKYRDLYGIMKRLVELGNEVHIFAGNITAYQTYQNIGAILYPPTDYTKMMKELPKFKYNIVGFNNKEDTELQVRYTLTNKMFEGLASGIPSLAFWCKESEKYIKKHNIGLCFKDIDEIGNTSHLEDKYNEIRVNIKTKQKDLVMENFIWRLENLYAKLLGVEGKKISNKIKKLSVFEYGKEDTYKLL